MPVNLRSPDNLLPVEGVALSAVEAGKGTLTELILY